MFTPMHVLCDTDNLAINVSHRLPFMHEVRSPPTTPIVFASSIKAAPGCLISIFALVMRHSFGNATKRAGYLSSDRSHTCVDLSICIENGHCYPVFQAQRPSYLLIPLREVLYINDYVPIRELQITHAVRKVRGYGKHCATLPTIHLL